MNAMQDFVSARNLPFYILRFWVYFDLVWQILKGVKFVDSSC